MPRRPGHGLGGSLFLLSALALLAGACQTSDVGTAGCAVARQSVMPASPLTLLDEARLDAVADGYVLWGVLPDAGDVRWAPVDVAGTLGPERRLAVPASAGGPWLAFTSFAQPADTVLVARTSAAPTAGDTELHVGAVPSDGAHPLPAGAPVVTIAGGAATSSAVALASTRAGDHAALAWVDPGAGLRLVSLSPAGEKVGDPLALDVPATYGCLAFQPGKGALTLTYYRYPDAASRVPTLVIVELDAAGSPSATLELAFDAHAARCARVTPTSGGYAVAFQDAQGAWLGVYLASTNRVTFVPFAQALDFGSAELQPPLVGLVPQGDDYGVVLSRVRGGELWRVTATGARLGVLLFPSVEGRVGTVATQPVAGGSGAPAGLVATYADYTGRAGARTDGQRYFLSTSCL